MSIVHKPALLHFNNEQFRIHVVQCYSRSTRRMRQNLPLLWIQIVRKKKKPNALACTRCTIVVRTCLRNRFKRADADHQTISSEVSRFYRRVWQRCKNELSRMSPVSATVFICQQSHPITHEQWSLLPFYVDSKETRGPFPRRCTVTGDLVMYAVTIPDKW